MASSFNASQVNPAHVQRPPERPLQRGHNAPTKQGGVQHERLMHPRSSTGGQADVSKSVEKARTHEFVLTSLRAGDDDRKNLVVSTLLRKKHKVFRISDLISLFQIHNVRVQWDPIPRKLREFMATTGARPEAPPGGLVILLLMTASGRSGSMAKALQTEALKHVFHSPWSNETIDRLRYILITEENANKGLRFAEGTTNEVRRTAALNNVNFGYHSDFIRDLMVHFANPADLFVDFVGAFEKLAGRAVSGVGAFRALHILSWLYIAFGVEIDVPKEKLMSLLGPNVVELSNMCKTAGFSLRKLYDAVLYELPDVTPVEFQIWSCKVVNLLHLLNLRKQPSLTYRRKAHGRRLGKKTCVH